MRYDVSSQAFRLNEEEEADEVEKISIVMSFECLLESWTIQTLIVTFLNQRTSPLIKCYTLTGCPEGDWVIDELIAAMREEFKFYAQ